MTEAIYKEGDIVSTIYDYELNSGIVVKVTEFGDGTDDYPTVYQYLVSMDTQVFGDSADYKIRSNFETNNFTTFNEDEISLYGISIDRLDKLLNQASNT